MKGIKRIITIVLVCFLINSVALSESPMSSLQDIYAEAELLIAQGDYLGAAAKFESLGPYSDSSQMAMYCKAIHVAENLNMYTIAIQTLNDLNGYKDSDQLAKYYEARSYEEGAIIEDLDSLSENTLTTRKAALEKAIKIYSTIPLFRDSLTRISECQLQRDKYNSKISDKKKKADDDKKEKIYEEAKSLLEKKKYVKAYESFVQIRGYKDVNTILSSDKGLKQVAKFKIGSTITFGQYEQDANDDNGKEPLQWIVIDITDDSALLISKYVIDRQPYCKKDGDAIWETSSLRKWLNSKFISAAFDKNEKKHIKKSTISNHGKLYHSRDLFEGNDTTDKVFLLSYEESQKYLPILYDHNLLNGIATDYLDSQLSRIDKLSKYYSEGKLLHSWALRSPGQSLNHSLSISVSTNHARNIAFYESWRTTSKVGVRPAFWYRFN